MLIQPVPCATLLTAIGMMPIFGFLGCHAEQGATDVPVVMEEPIEDKSTKRMPTSYPEAVEFIAGVELSEEFDWSRMSEIERLERWLVQMMPKGTLIKDVFYYDMIDPQSPDSQLKGWKPGMLKKEAVIDIALKHAAQQEYSGQYEAHQLVLVTDRNPDASYYVVFFIFPFEEIAKIIPGPGTYGEVMTFDAYTGEKIQVPSPLLAPGEEPLRPDQMGPTIYIE